MKYELPQFLPHCNVPKSHFCRTCREIEKGRVFRAGVLERQGIKDVHVDFECPKKKPWIEESIVASNINIDLVADKECKFCDDFDSSVYTLELYEIKTENKCFNLDFDINGYKSVKLNYNKEINGIHELYQDSYACLWKKKIPNAVEKFCYKTENCSGDFVNFDLLDIYIYLEKIDNNKFWVSISAVGGYDLFSSVVEVKKGKCLGTVEFLNEFKKENTFSYTDDILGKNNNPIGRVVGYDGKIISRCGKIK